MSDWEDLEAEARQGSERRGPQCGMVPFLDDILTEYGEDARNAIVRTLANHRLTTPSIRNALARRLPEGIDLPSTWTIQRHRGGRCSCKEAS